MNIAKLNTASLDDKTLIIKRGEGGETINNQDKVVDITENGTTEVVADGGYTGLGKVTINTEVSGETINNQDKVVNITENGTTEVVADGGYTGLGKVTINTEVSGGESGGDTSNWRYFDTTKATVSAGQIPFIDMMFSIFKEKSAGYTFIECNTPKLEAWEAKTVAATATDFNLKVYHPEFTLGGIMTIEELLNEMGGVENLEQVLGFTKITKEQFYSLD